MPTLEGLAEPGPGPPAARGRVVPLDATLGVEGLPQSGTGQAALLTGRNGALLHGGHFGPWIPVKLRPLVEDESWLRRAVVAGLPVAFANAYPAHWPGEGKGRRRVAGPPLAAKAAGLLTRDHTALGRREAVASEITNDGWRRWLGDDAAPVVSAAEAGAVLAGIAGRHALTLFAHYSTDTAGHRGGMSGGVEALERVDAFLGGLLGELAPDTTLLVVSDHGNIEDVRGGHTRNPALGLEVGPTLGPMGGLMDVTAAVLGRVGAA